MRVWQARVTNQVKSKSFRFRNFQQEGEQYKLRKQSSQAAPQSLPPQVTQATHTHTPHAPPQGTPTHPTFTVHCPGPCGTTPRIPLIAGACNTCQCDLGSCQCQLSLPPTHPAKPQSPPHHSCRTPTHVIYALSIFLGVTHDWHGTPPC